MCGKILDVWCLCNLFYPFGLSAILRQVTPQRAKHNGPVSQLAKHYVTYSKQHHIEISIILYYEEHFLKTWKPVKITRTIEEDKGNRRHNERLCD
jgi:hypothetical protein